MVALPGQRQSSSAASAVNFKGAFWFAINRGGLNVALFVDLLRRMMCGRRKSLHLTLGGLPAHKTSAVKEYVAGLAGKLTLHYSPGYATRRVTHLISNRTSWCGVTPNVPANARRPLRKGEKLVDRITAQLRDIGRRPSLVRSFFQHPSVAYITDC